MNKCDHEIGIIGGGPAGSTAAIYLAEYGFNVALFEKNKFPRETLCGEFLSSEVVYHLKKLNFSDEFLSLSPNKINSFSFFDNSDNKFSANLNFNSYGLSRSVFDNFLLCNSKRKGVHVFQPAEVKEIKNHGNYYSISIKNDSGKIDKKNIKFLIAAYGKQNHLDNLLKRDFIKEKSKLNGVKFHLPKNQLKNFNKNEIQIYADDNIYCGVNAVDKDLVTFCFLENRNENQPPPRKQLINLQKKNKFFAELFYENSGNLFDSAEVYGTGNIFFGKRNLFDNGIFMIGDSAAVIAPLAGDGIGMAMESAKLIADLFYQKKDDLFNLKSFNDYALIKFQNLYEKKWKYLFNRRIRTALLIQKFILKNRTRKSGIFILKSFPSVLPYLIKSTRNVFEYILEQK